MKDEKPIKIIRNNFPGSHPSETRIFAREIHEDVCKKPGCKFYNKPTQQGICHTTRPYLGPDWKHIELAMQHGQQALNEIKRMHLGQSPKIYVAYLESCYAMQWSNESFTMDELVYLRKELALAHHKLKKNK
jgi:hypothetical protein